MMFKKIKLPTAFVMIAIFSVAIILCCCTQQPVHAAQVSVKKSVPACHQQGKTKETQSQDCSCCSVKKITADSTVASPVIPDQIKTSLFIEHANAMPVAGRIKQYYFSLRDGPPGSSQVALYILHHSIRC